VPIAKEFNADLTLVVLVGSLTVWMRFVGAMGTGWMADRLGRRAPLMISILWYSLRNFIAGFSLTFIFLLVFRTLLGIGMGAERPCGAALATETWPARSRDLMASVLQGFWALDYLSDTVIYATLFDVIGWRGMLWMGVLPALAVVWICVYVKEGAGGLDRKPAAEESEAGPHEGAGRGAVPSRHRADHLVYLLVADQRVHRLLLDLWPIRDLYDAGAASVGRGGRLAAGVLQRVDLPGQLFVGQPGG
jgi:MFS family permease